MKLQERYNQVIARFEQAMPVAETELHYASPFQLLVAVILSAQCTDKRVNMVTPALFAAYPDAAAMAQASADDLLTYIHSVSYPNSKSQHLAAMARMLVSDFGGVVPSTIDEMQRLPGVGRKTANVIAAVVFDQPAMPVDTHVFRVSNRRGLTRIRTKGNASSPERDAKTPLETERILTKHIPPALIPKAHHWLILHGRYVCQARKPKCDKCCINDLCLFFHSLPHLKETNP